MIAFVAAFGGMVGAAAAQEPVPAVADESASARDGDIIVTARKRAETSLDVPVAISAIGSEELSRRQIVDLESIARVVPNLFIGPSSGGPMGSIIALRGIGAGETNTLGDQAVAFSIDGVQIARSSPKRLGSFDMAQVEVLRGPQALFFGKNSPGGVVVIRSADPGDRLEAGFNVGYEFEAEQVRSEAFLSAPIGETLGVRLAVLYSDMEGWVDNVAPAVPGYGARERKLPSENEIGARLTLKFEPSDSFDARLKLTYGRVRNAGIAANTQRVACPFGAAQLGIGTNDDCTANDTIVRADIGTNFGVLNPIYRDGVPYLDQKQYLAGLEMNFRPSDSLTLTSQSSYFGTDLNFFDNFNANSADSPAALARLLVAAGDVELDEYSQELRLASDFDGPLNFMVGGFYQDTKISYLSVLARNGLAPTYSGLGDPTIAQQDGKAWSAFGQVTFEPVPTLELSAGGRYSHEEKQFRPVFALTGQPVNPALPGGTVVPDGEWSDFSPEATITWKPTDDLSVYAAYKQGFLSGGFNGGSGNLALDRSYDQQTVEGFEAGVKALLFDRRLRINFAAYRYDIKGQQVSSVDSALAQTNITNAASSKSEGLELDAQWQLTDAFSLRGAASYNRARYDSYANAPCFAGQTPAQGCVLVGTSALQDLSGRVLARAPEWTAGVGTTYELPVGVDDKIFLSADANYTDGYFTDTTLGPGTIQDSYWLVDASIGYRTNSGLELALIGRNLTNEYYFQRTTDAPFTGSGTGTAAGVRADTLGYVGRGRELSLRLSYRFR
ncbi:TonB-dependent receptor [Sphingopyxis sp.]|uniref:TonB-dependent receptor n=1 Tax=Sphingopyxis sp. TaxID=1908224 RepID=UPI003F707334